MVVCGFFSSTTIGRTGSALGVLIALSPLLATIAALGPCRDNA
jgi:hypothetical protein